MIEFKCPHCQRKIKVSDDAGGKSGRCHGCNNQIDVPVKPELVVAGGTAQLAPAAPALPDRVPCVFCGEDIAYRAIKCRHCGEFQDGRQQTQVMRPQEPSVVVNVSAPRDYRPTWNPVVAVFFAFLFPGLGQLYKGQALRGFMWFWAIVLGYLCYILPGIILQFFCVVDAAISEPDKKRYR